MAEPIGQTLKRYFENPDELHSDLERDQVIHEETVRMELARQAELFSKWSRLEILANEQLEAYKEHTNVTIWLSAKAQARGVLKASGEKDTASRAEELAYQSEGYLHAKHYLRKWETLAGLLKTAVATMYQRKDMLQSLNSRQKVDLDGLPSDATGVAIRDRWQGRQ